MPDQKHPARSHRAAATPAGRCPGQQITVTPFNDVPDGPGQPDCKIAATAQFTSVTGLSEAQITLFQLEDGRIGVGVYPGAGDQGTVLRWDAGLDAPPTVIHWRAPRGTEGACG